MDDLFTWAASQPVCQPAAAVMQTDCNGAAERQCSEPLPPDLPAIFTVLQSHRGADSAITAPCIADAAGLYQDAAPANRGTRVRKLLELYQDAWPWPLVADANGYYIATTAAELAHYCANLRSRALCDFRRFATIRKHGRRAGFTYLGKGRWADSTAKGS